jgi:predicted nucleic acid-binding protein
VFSFTSVTVYEIVYGLQVKGAAAQLQKVSAWLRQNDEVAPLAENYIAAASIRAKATRQGAPIELRRRRSQLFKNIVSLFSATYSQTAPQPDFHLLY